MNRARFFFRMVGCLTTMLIFCLTLSSAFGAADPVAYEKAKAEFARLRGDEKRAAYRQEWLDVADAFMAVYNQNPRWGNRSAALFRSAEALEELARRSYTPKDAQAAASRFESLADKHPSSVLADDALYRAAVIRNELMRDPQDAKALLEIIQQKYGTSDHAAKATAYFTRLSRATPASSGTTPQPGNAAQGNSASGRRASGNASAGRPAAGRPVQGKPQTALVSGITSQQRKVGGRDTVRITIALNKAVEWQVRHQAADAKEGRPARLTLELSGASPAQALSAGERYTNMGQLVRHAVDYTAGKDQTRVLFDFRDLRSYTVKTSTSPFRIVIEGSASEKLLPGGTSLASVSLPPARPASRAAAPPNVAAQLGLTVETVVIDPGHGGKDPGTGHNNLVEREVSLDVAKRLANMLRASGYKVVLTRDRDEWISLTDRTKLAERAKGDVFVSIHVNASEKTEKSGFETYYLDLANSRDVVHLAAMENAGGGRNLGEMEAILTDLLLGARTQESRRLAGIVQDRAVATLKKQGMPARDGGTKGAPFHVLIGSSMPGILVEVGYCSNVAEAKMLRQGKYRDALAEGIANGIHAYAQQLVTAGR